MGGIKDRSFDVDSLMVLTIDRKSRVGGTSPGHLTY